MLHVFGTPYIYEGKFTTNSLSGVAHTNNRQFYTNGHHNEKTARVIAVLDEVYHLLEQDHDFLEDVSGIDPFRYCWQVKPQWADQWKRDVLISKIDAEFVKEMTGNSKSLAAATGARSDWPYGPHAIWQMSGVNREPDFYRLDYAGRLALCLKLDKALADAERPDTEEVKFGYPATS